jgi:hypothetical protein
MAPKAPDAPLASRPEVDSSVKTLAAEAAKPKAQPKPATKEAASAAEQKVKTEKP